MTIDRWLAVLGLAVGVLAIPITLLVSRYYYRRADKKRVPTFVVQTRSSLSKSALATSVADLRVSFRGQDVGKKGISEAKIYFWNSGPQAIEADNVFTPYTISLPVPILSYSVNKVSREVTHLSVSQSRPDQLTLGFSVLEAGDGCTLTIVYDGPPETSIEFDGASLDSPKPLVLPPHEFYSVPKSKRLISAYGPVLGIPIVLAACGFVFVVLFFGAAAGLSWILKRLLGERTGTTVFESLAVLFVAAMFLSTIGSIVWPRIRRVSAPYLPPDIKG